MQSKTIASSACYISPKRQKNSIASTQRPRSQHGVSLIELMIGIIIGLLTVVVALGTLMVSRGVTGTVSDASQLQQQAAYVFRVMSLQLRQAGSLRLNPAPDKTAAGNVAVDIADPVAFETKVAGAGGFDPTVDTIGGLDTPGAGEFKLTTGYRNYKDALYASSTDESLQRNCLGETNSDNLIQSRFVLDTTKNSLSCAGSGDAQPFAEKIANFQVRYLLQDPTTPGDPKVSYANATTVGNDWRRVQGVEVCLVLYGNEAIDMPAGTSYIDCDGTTAVNITALPVDTATIKRRNRMHMVFRNVYQLRSQGLI